MTVTMTTVTGPVYLPNGLTPLGGKVSFELSSWDIEDTSGLVITGPVYVDIDANGQFSVDLFTSTAGNNSVNYRMFVLWEDSTLAQSYVNDIYVSNPIPHYTKKYIGTFTLSGPGPFQLSELNIISELNNSSFNAYLEMKAYADRIDLGALDAAVVATSNNVTLTNADVVQTGLDRIATNSDTEQTVLNRTAAETAQAAAETAAVAAVAALDDVLVATTGLGENYQTRAAFVAAISGGATYTVGDIVEANGYKYYYDGSSTVIPDMTGWRPLRDESLEHFGILPSVPTAGFNAAALGLAGKVLIVPDGHYIFTAQANLTGLSGIHFEGQPTFDFSSATDAAGFTALDGGSGHVYLYGGDLFALDDITANVSKGDSTLTFAADQGLQSGDIIGIYNPTDFSYHGSRSYYRAGEWCRVAVNAATVELFGSLYDDYAAAAVEIYKHPKTSFVVSGGTLTILESTAVGAIAGFHAKRIAGADFSRIQPKQSEYAGMVLTQCLDVTGTGYSLNQTSFGGSGTYYGIAWSNCQDCSIEGYLYGGRHGTTTGGASETMAVPCRNITVRGTAKNAHDAAAGIAAVNCHANTEYFTFEGLADGGWSGGGNFTKFRGTIIAKASQLGLAIYFGEMSGFDHDFSGTRIIAYGNPATISRGCIDCGGNSVAIGSDTKVGGTLNFSNVKLIAEDTTRAITIRNRGYVGGRKMNINLAGFELKDNVAAGCLILFMSVVSGTTFGRLNLSGLMNGPGAGWSVSGVDKISGWKASGTATVTPASTSTSIAEVVVAINAPKLPVVNVSLNQHLVGNKKVIPSHRLVTATSFRARADTADSTNFGTTTSGILHWLATIDDD